MKPYDDTEPKKEQIRRMFDGIAPRYDLLNRVLSFGVDRGWRRKLIKQLKGQNPRRILDIATGTGDLAFAAAKVCPDAVITGYDLSEGMLAVAKKRAAESGLEERIGFMQGEAENLPFEDRCFDAVTASFGVRNFDDIPRGLAEMVRILEVGGRLYILEFSSPKNKAFGALYRWYFHKVLPLIGGLVSKDMRAYGYLPSSVEEFPAPEHFVRMMERAGLSGCRYRRFTNGIACLYIGTKQY